MLRSKITRDILRKVLGESVLATISACNAKGRAVSRGDREASRRAGERLERAEEDGYWMDPLCGTDVTPGKLQVPLSWSSGDT